MPTEQRVALGLMFAGVTLVVAVLVALARRSRAQIVAMIPDGAMGRRHPDWVSSGAVASLLMRLSAKEQWATDLRRYYVEHRQFWTDRGFDHLMEKLETEGYVSWRMPSLHECSGPLSTEYENDRIYSLARRGEEFARAFRFAKHPAQSGFGGECPGRWVAWVTDAHLRP